MTRAEKASLAMAAIAAAVVASVVLFWPRDLAAARRPEVAPAPPAAAAGPAPAAAGERDPREDLKGQMMWDPLTKTYIGG